eukprot:3707830-Rhodomonas_salina.2
MLFQSPDVDVDVDVSLCRVWSCQLSVGVPAWQSPDVGLCACWAVCGVDAGLCHAGPLQGVRFCPDVGLSVCILGGVRWRRDTICWRSSPTLCSNSMRRCRPRSARRPFCLTACVREREGQRGHRRVRGG